MATVNNCNIPDDLYYVVEKHVWARPEGDLVTVGLTDVAQNMARTIISAVIKAEGKPVKKGRSIATVESGKWVGPVPSPVAGEIAEVNPAVTAAPSTINHAPYGDGWIVKIRAEDWERDSADLATGESGVEAYRAFLDAEGISCHDNAHEED